MDGIDYSGLSDQEKCDKLWVAASTELQRTDYKVTRAMERMVAGDEWCKWRDIMRDAKKNPHKYDTLPPEPPFGKTIPSGEAAPAPAPEVPVVADELAKRRRQVQKLKDEIEALTKQLADANHDNDALKDRIGELESELAKANEPPPLLPDPTTSMLEFDESFKPLRGLMEDGETVSMAKKRLYPRLMEELQNLKNQEALFDKTIPRRAEVEQLLGILARVGEH